MSLTEKGRKAGFPVSLGDRTLATYLELAEEVESALEEISLKERAKLQLLFHTLDRKVEQLLFLSEQNKSR